VGPTLLHRHFRDLPDLLRPGDLLVVNRSAVFPARLLGSTRGGGSAEILLLRPVPGTTGALRASAPAGAESAALLGRGWATRTASAAPQRGEIAGAPAIFEAFVRPGRRLRPGDTVRVAEGALVVHVESRALGPDGRRRVRLEAPACDVGTALDRHGQTPLPPYIRRPPTESDRQRYQTVYARESGSVAAPTAGLHFTPELLDALARRGVERAEVVLHVGPGTFQPVKVERVEDHRVAAEPFVIPEATAEAVTRARAGGGRVVAVGTTSVRALEAATDAAGRVRAGAGETDLVIVPGHRFRAVDALVTNFHLPRSSLLLLVCALAGREPVLAAYGDALRAGYRFYSYGDAMLIT
jgi:S-adenosylmethionine:tRNA ribosyltransferase-isomerase